MGLMGCGTWVRRAGASADDDGTVRWRVWAPAASAVTLVLIYAEQRREIAMTKECRGYHHASAELIGEGQRYAFRLDDGLERADPCSLWQPEGLDGPSAVLFPERFTWTDRDWRGVPRADLVFYEIHVGTFTPKGTFEAIIPRLEQLRELGITALEIMPVAQFPGSRNWGYDGVLAYAVQNSYGGPHGLQRLVDACHDAGLAIYLDVVYNHFGPESNYLGEFGPYFTEFYRTPWGDAVNYDHAGCDAVREFVLSNVRMWLAEFHLDGLRLDAADMIFDRGARHILDVIKSVAEDVGEGRGWPAVVIAESDLNDPRLLYSAERGGYGLDGQWMDDHHHAIHAFLTGERQWYYADFTEPIELAEVLEHPYVYDGKYSRYRDHTHGAPAIGLAGDRFVVFLQNHDQVGNRPCGERLGTLLTVPAKKRLAASYLLLSPYLPLLFMGEEYGEENPFPYFCSFHGEELIRAVREGRRQAHSAHDPHGRVPDPAAPETFESAHLTWSWPEGSDRAGLRRLYRDLLTARREWPALGDYVNRSARLIENAEGARILELERGDPNGANTPDQREAESSGILGEQRVNVAGVVRAYFNLEDRPQSLPADIPSELTLRFSSEAQAYGGRRDCFGRINEISAYECVVFGPSSWRSFP